MLLGAIEAGGTKFVCAVGNENGDIFERIIIPTTVPSETMNEVIKFFKLYNIEGLGVGCFGPIDLNTESKTYGYIKKTPKIAWQDYDMVGFLKKELGVPVAFDTDVNVAALGENIFGAAKDVDGCIYITVGTGIGVGAIVEGNILHGLTHPEMGHILIKSHPQDSFEGICPFHKNCLEGLASGPSMEKRWGISAKEISQEHKAWEIESYYLAQGIMTYILTLSPKKIILGGGVLKRDHILKLVREKVLKLLNGYIQSGEIVYHIDNYIVSPGLEDNSGICGALALAKKSL